MGMWTWTQSQRDIWGLRCTTASGPKCLWCRSPHWFLPSLPWSISRCLAVLLLLWRWHFGNQVPTLCQRHRSPQCHWKETFLPREHRWTHALNRDHQYHYQVPAQLFVTRRKFCDLMVWSTSNFFVQRILPDADFFYRSIADPQELE